MREMMNISNERGYTFLESIFQLVILAIFLHLFLMFFFWKSSIEQKYFDYASTEFELFSADMQHLLSDVSELRLIEEGSSIRLRNSRGLINIEQSGTVLRKRVDQTGHVPYITNVRAVTYTFDGTTLTARVTMLDGTLKVRGFAVGLYPK
ncbi:competence type IV pilus minor pilin ComGF [Sporosarcina sp. JAI121]|uniref:competence type IV pilus minor pilin ComGF n=1 Tax=Sporosarcina sp. JAI121 TaxID=2723064 RepID=UPI0015CE3D12|nr:competence type IV pilus minor pilin ComGF [Sporosarcina sp. JAI121]NYF24596.1 competence protein ComGF [Sporosarcina sp. JAI121]